jgi:hypothetical protein
LFGWQKKVKGKKVKEKNGKGMKVSRKWDDCLVVWNEWKWKENEKKERYICSKWHNYPPHLNEILYICLFIYL